MRVLLVEDDPMIAKGLQTALRQDGYAVDGVSDGRHAAEAGIQPGDVVLSVDGTPVQSVAQLRALVHEHDKQVALLIQRGDSRIFIPVGLG
jgi:serine protease Do